LAEFKVKHEKALEFDADMAKDYNFPKPDWKKATGRLVAYSGCTESSFRLHGLR